MSSLNELIINIHLFKTAGTTLRHLLEREYSSSKVLLIKPINWNNNVPLVRHIQNKLRSLKVITGHFGYNLWAPHYNAAILPKLKHYRNISYITMLRNPVDRKVSEYFYIEKQYKNTPNELKSTLREYVNKNICNNLQTYYLSSGTNNLNIAKQNLAKFKAIGITERFYDSVTLLKRTFNWRSPIDYSSLNVNKERPKLDIIPQDIIKSIIDNNPLDMELYRFAQELFKKRFASINKSIHYFRSYRSRSRGQLSNKRRHSSTFPGRAHAYN